MKISVGLGGLVLLSVISSCSPILGMYGIRNPKKVNEKTIFRTSKRLDIPISDVYELDSSYFTFLFSLDTTKFKEEVKNHCQPLQALYFNRSGQMESFQINCYAGGFPNLNWARDSILMTFPPKQQAPVDTIILVNTQLEYLKPMSSSQKVLFEDYDFIVFVYWSKFMGRQNRRFIDFIQENLNLIEGYDVRIIYVNTDNIFALSGLW
ncbi:MAG: hypothetical protein AB8H47_18615 [Bacteroidia bacterium]